MSATEPHKYDFRLFAQSYVWFRRSSRRVWLFTTPLAQGWPAPPGAYSSPLTQLTRASAACQPTRQQLTRPLCLEARSALEVPLIPALRVEVHRPAKGSREGQAGAWAPNTVHGRGAPLAGRVPAVQAVQPASGGGAVGSLTALARLAASWRARAGRQVGGPRLAHAHGWGRRRHAT